MSRDRDPLPGEIRPPGAEPPGAGEDASGDEASVPGPDGIPADEAGPIGIFPSWGWVYGTVIVWATVMVVILYVFTVTFDYTGR